MMRTKELDWLRQLGVIPPEKLQFPITLVGAGGIGSPCAIALAKMGCSNLTIWDFDTVEEHNIANQLYPIDAVGKLKVEALSAVVEGFGGLRPQVVPKAFAAEERVSGVVCACVDTMEARRQIWQAVRFKPAVSLYLDARVAGEIGVLYTVKPCDIHQVRFYEQTLYSDEEALDLPCTERSIIYNGFFVAALMVSQIKKHALDQELHDEIIFDLRNIVVLSPQNHGHHNCR
jgi:hypothetical protein